MGHFVFYSKLVLALGKAAFVPTRISTGCCFTLRNRFVCRSNYGMEIFFAIVYNDVEVKVALRMGCAVCKRAEQINTNGIDLFNEPLLYDFNFVHKCPAPFAYNTIANCKTIINDEQESGNL